MKLFLILGNQLFNTQYLKDYSDYTFYMSEDHGLCTFEKHHKLKILLFLSSMRSYQDELRLNKFKLIYNDCNKDFKDSYENKLSKIVKEKKVKEVAFFEIEDKFFEKRILTFLRKNKINFKQIKSPMFLTSRDDFKKYLVNKKKPSMASFYKINGHKFKLNVGSPVR